MPTSTTAVPPTEAVTRHFTLDQVHAPARSVVLITEAIHEVFPPAGGRALVVVPMEAVSMAVVVSMAVADIIANRMY